MSRKNKREIARVQTNSLTADEAEELFSKVDETGHTNVETAQRQRRHRHLTGTGVDIDPLSADDPSGSNVGKTIAKAAAIFVAGFFVLIVGTQLVFGYVRRSNTANLSTNVNVRTVASALRGGVEWGNGFTQFPEDFSVQEADENAGRVEVTVIDTTSETVLEALAGSQVQAAAFSTNALLNQNINTVTYHVQVYLDAQGKIATSSFFGFVKPSGNLTSLMTFVWTKTYTEDGGETWHSLPADATVSMNLWGFTPGFVEDLKRDFRAFLENDVPKNPMKAEYFLPFVVNDQIRAGKADVRVLKSADKWYGVTYKEDKPVVMRALADMMASGVYPDPLWK